MGNKIKSNEIYLKHKLTKHIIGLRIISNQQATTGLSKELPVITKSPPQETYTL